MITYKNIAKADVIKHRLSDESVILCCSGQLSWFACHIRIISLSEIFSHCYYARRDVRPYRVICLTVEAQTTTSQLYRKSQNGARQNTHYKSTATFWQLRRAVGRRVGDSSPKMLQYDASGMYVMAIGDSPEQNFYFCSTSQAALKALSSPRTRSPLVQECGVELVWIQGHCGILGNKKPDELFRDNSRE
ncbi:hypothetical protein NQ317_011154 [Molorchus minor]|uniref:RNase H type-1 domain-containing protein n=1 Tax=Molorchus minor TaxID=1323400 RepID=A0ABQ9JEN6_9CUCU|nr:hypothetical protein NQ317_011154 [Molorchus minor]